MQINSISHKKVIFFFQKFSFGKHEKVRGKKSFDEIKTE